MVSGQYSKRQQRRKKAENEAPRFCRTLLSASIALALSSNYALAEPPRGAFPRACAATACNAAGGPDHWVSYGQASLGMSVDGHTMTINQQSDKATLNWQSFDIGADNTVHFDQPSNTSVALNRVWDQTNPTQIFGHLTADGQVYIYNRNGILFGPNASVDVNSLVATTLDVSDSVFEQGLATAINNIGSAAAAFKGNGHSVVVDATGNPILFAAGTDGKPGRFQVDESGVPVRDENGALIPDGSGRLVTDPEGVPLAVVVDVAEGAELNSQNYGSIMLLGANISNAGHITTPDGQAILAAGNKVYLQSDKDLHGFLVEVDVDEVSNEQLNTALNAGEAISMGRVSNKGSISAPRGNITLAGLVISQQGWLSATSAATVNGSIRLLARDKLSATGTVVLDADGLNMTRTGSVTFGEASHTEVALDSEKAAATAVDEQAALPSTLTVMGRKIDLLSGSEIVAPAGDVSLTALAQPGSSATSAKFGEEDGVKINIESGSRIDVSGVTTQLAMERNVIEVELRGNELADSPLQRDGILAGEKVNIDIRTVDDNGRIPIADVSNALAGIERTVAERSTEGGSVTIASTGKADFQAGAQIDVSGGAVVYQDGYVATSKLLADGQTYDISEADPNRHYDGVLFRQISQSQRWGEKRSGHVFGGNAVRGRFEQGYVDGKDAGSVSFTAYDPTLAGSLIGERSIGRYQRESGQLPLGGELVIGDAAVLGIEGVRGKNYLSPDVLIAQQGFIDSLREQALLPQQTLTLSTDYLQQGGFTRTRINSNGNVTLAKDTPLQLAPGGELAIHAGQVDIKSDIEAPSGMISLNAVDIDPDAQNAKAENYLHIADQVSLSTRGTWSNDASAAAVHGADAPVLDSPALPDGGSIELALDSKVSELAIGDDVSLDVSAGGWLQADGKLQPGKGGSLTIATTAGNNHDAKVHLGDNLALHGEALQQGGSLTLRLPAVVIDGEASAGLSGIAAQHNDLGDLTSTQREALVQQVLAQWQAAQTDTGVSSNDAQVLAVLDQATSTLKNDGSQTVEQQQALVQSTIDETRMPLMLAPQLFQSGGFSHYRVEATQGDLIVSEDTHIQPLVQNRVLDAGFRSQPSGTDITQFSHVEGLHEALRRPTDLDLAVTTEPEIGEPLPALRLETGSVIETDAQARVALSSGGRLDVDGRIKAAAGSIQLSVDNNSNKYDSERGIHLGEQAILDAAGSVLLHPNEEGLRQGEVLSGGQVQLTAIGGDIDMATGAVIDVSGSEAILDLPGDDQRVQAQHIASSAGAIDIKATESVRLDGSLQAQANQELGASGGALSLTITSTVSGASLRSDLDFPTPVDPLTGDDAVWSIQLTQSEDATVGVPNTGEARVNVAGLSANGFDALKLNAARIQFDGDIGLHLGRSIVLDSAQLQLTPTDAARPPSQVLLDAPYIALGSSGIVDRQASAGNGRLVVGDGNTYLVDLVGKGVVQGASSISLNSLGDIRLHSTLDEYSSSNRASGFNVAGSLELTAAQVYPTTLSRFTLASADVSDGVDVTPGRITIEPGSGEATPVLSAGGKVTLDAAVIENNGVLKAPLGEIQLGGDDVSTTQSIILGDGSITSTAADVGQVPFGYTIAGSQWQYSGNSEIEVYNEGATQFPKNADATTASYDAIPEQHITLRGQDIAIAEGAMVDAHGGGDVVAYEFLPGPGGSRDVLATANAVADGRYAILPWLQGGYAPYDTQAFKDWTLDAGASVEILQDSNGLAAGVYPLLPASYALLPGAYLVTMEDGYRDLTTTRTAALLDGSRVVPARMATANTSLHDGRTLGLTLHDTAYTNSLAEYQTTHLGQFLLEHGVADGVAIPRLPQDAGNLVIEASDNVTLDGHLNSLAGDGGTGAQVDIVADQLEIVSQYDSASTAVQIRAADLNDFGAQSVLIGGTRSSDANGVRINVGASQVDVKADVELEVPELILAAGVGDSAAPEAASAGVHVEAGASLQGRGSFSGQAADLVVGRDAVTDDFGNVLTPAISGGGALLRVSSANQVSVHRANSDAGSGALAIAEGATIGADESMVLDATGASQIAGTLDISGGSLNLGAEQVSLGEVPAEATGLVIDNADLSNWALRELVLTSRSDIDFYGNVAFGTDAEGNTLLQSLALEAPGIINHGGDTSVTAGSIRLTSPTATGSGAMPLAADSGSLTLNASLISNGDGEQETTLDGSGELLLGAGDFALGGYEQVTLNAERQISSSEEGRLNVAADLTLDTPLLTTGAGVRTTIGAGEHNVRITASGSESSEAGNLGGTLTINGGAIDHDGVIRLRSGQVILQAQGVDGDVNLHAGSVVDVSGLSRSFDEVTVDSWGGEVTLRAEDGDVISHAGSLVNVAAADAGNGADAGSLRVQAQGEGERGQVTLGGTLQGTAQQGFRQGSFEVDARQLVSSGDGSGFNELNQALNAGGFSERREIRLRSGDITVEAGAENAVAARNVVLTADGNDNGRIIINGSIGLAAQQGGDVSLNARGDVVLNDGAEIKASSLGDGEDGGQVLLASEQGSLIINSGSQIDTAAGAGGANGEVHLRAARRDSDGDGHDDTVAIAPIAGTINNSDKVVVEAVKVDDNSGDLTIDSARQTAWQSETQNFMDLHAADIAASLDAAGSLPLVVTPGLEVRASGSITLANAWDLSGWRYGDAPGVLTLRAQDNVLLNQGISDGFRANALQSDDSWSYRIIAGADGQSANVLATLPQQQLAADKGDVILAANSVVRSGNGDIDVIAGRNVNLQSTSSVIYSAGTVPQKDGVSIVPETALSMISWGDGGGDVTISAAANLVGQFSNQSPNSWLWRQGGEYGFGGRAGYTETKWAVDYTGFQQGVAAFGSGDIQLSAGGNIKNFSAAIPSTGRQANPGSDRSVIDSWGGGDLNVNAGGDIQGGLYLVGRGAGRIHAGGAMTTAGDISSTQSDKNIYPFLALGEGSLRVQTGGDLLLETVTQPTAFPRRVVPGPLYKYNSEFFIYDPLAEVELDSLGGDIRLQPNIEKAFTDTSSAAISQRRELALLPPTVKMIALDGSITFPDRSHASMLQPSSQGNLWLLAKGNIDTSNTGILLPDFDPALLPQPGTPTKSITTLFGADSDQIQFESEHALVPLHWDDSEPAYIVSNSGDIRGTYSLSKQTHIVAGRDIHNIGLTVQNINQNDVTLVQAGRDIRFTQSEALVGYKIQVDGPGRLNVVAGRNLNLGASNGITTSGDLYNSVLPTQGADISVLVGVAEGLDQDSFITTYLVDSEVYRDDLTGYMRELLVQSELSAEDALQQFQQLSPLQQRPLVLQTLYAELRASCVGVSDGTGSYDTGYQALNTLFPENRNYQGDLAMYLSRIYSVDGGDINIAVPGGLVNAGLAISADNLGIEKGPSDLGIVAQRQGHVFAMTRDDFIVNQSRVSTLLGGDVGIWSSYGNIDAGRGAKSAISAPEPTYTFDANGNLVADFGGAIAGSGIRAISTSAAVTPGDVFLCAPAGKVDAGDAGILAEGNLTIGAQQVVGTENINVGGVATGVPADSSVGLAAGLTNASNLASGADKSAQDNLASATDDAIDTPLADAALSFLEVEVLGFGGRQSQELGTREPGKAKNEDEEYKEEDKKVE